MICRVWRGWTSPENAAAYQSLLTGEIMPEILGRGIPGLIRYQAVQRAADGDDGAPEVEHMTLIWFESLDAVRGFVGDEIERANMPKKAAAILKRWDARVAHFEVFGEADA